ncbi:hypothetical protein N7G274_009432 [Stereocaulon virgatum]|uniref:Uncharacterized protein n=1 Tax=Stereocaulon virgatum TaxID=373712 RepID=A0ABR3ZWF6_9LECA
MATPARPYLSNGQMLQAPPLSARVLNFADSTYAFLGLYVTTLFSLDAYAAAEQSSYNIRNRNRSNPVPRSGPRPGGGGGGSGGGGGGGGGGGKKLGTVDDIRGPECKSCG